MGVGSGISGDILSISMTSTEIHMYFYYKYLSSRSVLSSLALPPCGSGAVPIGWAVLAVPMSLLRGCAFAGAGQSPSCDSFFLVWGLGGVKYLCKLWHSIRANTYMHCVYRYFELIRCIYTTLWIRVTSIHTYVYVHCTCTSQAW